MCRAPAVKLSTGVHTVHGPQTVDSVDTRGQIAYFGSTRNHSA